MRKKERYEKILAWFRENVPVAETELHYDNPFELLIAVILSAQCTDKRVNMITPALYRDFPTPEALAATTPDVVYEYIRSVSYPNNKAKHLVGMAQMLVKEFNSEVPDTLEELAQKAGINGKNLVETVKKWNEFCKKGTGDEMGRPTCMDEHRLDEGGPYYATLMTPSVHHTMGGVRINEKAQALTAEGKAIPGLWAAGEVTGVTHGTNRLGGNAYTDIIVFGRIAGKAAAEAAK